MKKIPYATQWIGEDDIKDVSEALRADYLTQGPRVAEFEKKVAEYCGAKYAVAVNSGTSALHAACFAAGISPGDEVITSPITFVASANCILYCGGKPVFADVQENTINIDPEEIAKKITKKTKAIIPVHFAGHPCDLEEIHAIAKRNDIIMIEDAAHAMGASYKESKIGSSRYSDMTILSFHAVKHITTGEGGMILTNKKDYYEKLLMFRSHGITRDTSKLTNKKEDDWYYEMQLLGFNYRITDFQCALGIQQLRKLEDFIKKRREIVENYNNAFEIFEEITIPTEPSYVKSSWHLFTIRVREARKRIFKALREKGIGVNVHYIPVYWQPYYQKLGYKKGICPRAEKYYEQAITLPLYPRMKDTEIKYVIDMVKEAIKPNDYFYERAKVGVIVQARMGSTRLPGKVMLPLAGKPVLYRVIERLADCRTTNKIVIATTKKRRDDPIVSLAKKMGVEFYRGSEEDALSRYYETATNFNFDIIVRVTSDCPLIDPEILDEMVMRFKELNSKDGHCDYLSNTLKRTFPRGLDIEIFWYDVLQRAHIEAKNPHYREHVTLFINENPNKFKLVNYSSPDDSSKYRCTIDEEDDYQLIYEIYDQLYFARPKFRFEDILKIFKEQPNLFLINKHVKQKGNTY